jgi:hypothetical protein
MADKRISQLVDRGTVVNNDVVPIVVSGATTTNKATISSIQTFMQGNLDLGVTSVGITIGTSGTNVSVTGSPVTSSGNITINIPTASATNRGALSSADWSTFNGKQNALTNPITGTGATGQVAYWNGTNSQTGSNNLFWDNANVKLGIGTNTPESTGLTIAGGGMIVSLDSGSARKVLELYATSTGAKVSSSYVGASSYGSLELLTSGLPRLTIADTGGVTLTGALNGTSASFSGNGSFGGAAANVNPLYVKTATDSNLRVTDAAGTLQIAVVNDAVNAHRPFMLGNGWLNFTNTGAATFSSSVTASGLLSTNDRLYMPGNQPISNWFSSSLSAGYSSSNGYGWVNGAGNLVLGTDGVERMRITSAGNVGIGTASPVTALTIFNNSSGLRFQNSTTGIGSGDGSDLFLDGSDFYIRNIESGFIGFATANTERMRITSVGYLRMASGTGGIQFNGDTAAANALNDYEEGTWTPTIGGTWITNPTSLSGLYTKIGNMVYIRLEFTGGVKATTTSGWINGLPFSGAVGGGGTVSNVSVQNRGIALLDNNTRIWLTELDFLGLSTKVMASYRL